MVWDWTIQKRVDIDFVPIWRLDQKLKYPEVCFHVNGVHVTHNMEVNKILKCLLVTILEDFHFELYL